MANFRNRLRERKTLYGSLLTLGAPEVAEIFALSGYDWLWIDLEHTALTLERAQQLVQATAGRLASLVRVPWNDHVLIKRVLDIGCDGVIIPQIRTVEEARQAVAAAKYPPAGIRSVGIARAQQYGMTLQECVQKANDEVAVILQIEHIDAVPHIVEIVQVPGVDAIIIGPYDLSGSMGMPGQIDHPDVAAMVNTISESCMKHDVPWGAFSPDAERAAKQLAQGATLIVLGTDTMHLWRSAQQELKMVPNRG